MLEHVGEELTQLSFILVVLPGEHSQAHVDYLQELVREFFLHLTAHVLDEAVEVAMELHLPHHLLDLRVRSLQLVIG